MSSKEAQPAGLAEKGLDNDTLYETVNYPKDENDNISTDLSSREIQDGATSLKGQDELAKEENDEPVYITGFPLIAVMGSVTLTVFLMLMDTSILATAVPHITDDFHSLHDIGWYASAYTLANASLQLLTGKFFTYFRSKWLYLGFFGIFELGSLLCGAAVSSNMLIVGRAVAGLGGAGLFTGAFTIIAGVVPLERRPAVTGILMGFSQLGLIAGPLIGGALTTYATWRWCFYINLPVGAVAAVALILCPIPEQIEKPSAMSVLRDRAIWRKFDLTGAALCAGMAIQLLLALEYGGAQFSWDSATIIGLFCGAGATAAVFLYWEYRCGENAMIPFAMLRRRVVWTSVVASGFLFVGVLFASYFLPLYFQAVQGLSALMSGVYLLPSILSQLFLAVVSGILVGRLGYYLPWMVMSGAVTAIGAGLISTFSTTTSVGEQIGYQIILGAGRGAGMQMGLIAIQSSILPTQISLAMAMVGFVQNLASSIMLTVGNTVFDTILKNELHQHAPEVDAGSVIAAGATAFRNVVSPEDLPGVLTAYADSFDQTFYIVIGVAIGIFIFAWGMGWNDVRKKNTPAPTDV